GFGGQNFRSFSPQNLRYASISAFFGFNDTENFASYKTASHLKKRKIRGFFGAEDAVRLMPYKDNKP
ncbi:MAG: hypothetical protein IK086_03645, partial [Clostridia bacterium]|nr:hypothetical protein [Clostridia bacterium]